MSTNNAQTGHASVNGAELYYEMAGEGLPLILLHAGVADGRMWDDQVSAFAAHYQVIRFDYRGFGQSAMPPGKFCNHADVAGLLDFLQIEQAVVVGISFGGKIALDFALAYPSRVIALVLGAPSVGGTPPSGRIRRFWQEEEAAIDADDFDTAVELNLRLWVDGIFREPDQVDTAVRQKVGIMQRRAFEAGIPADIEEIELEPPASGRLAEISIPTLILVGDLDLPEKVVQAQQLANTIPQAQLVSIPGVAHMLNMEAPHKFNQATLAFLAKYGT